MICISVTPKSRTLAPADLLNASRHCDLIELCIDHFIKEPNLSELIRAVDKPILISCRREKDGGKFTGSEADRLQLLRNAIVAGPAYIELDLDIADRIPRFGNTRRVISYSSLNRPLSKIDDIFEQCWKAKADVVKVTWPTDDLDAAWPMLAAVTQKRELPVVGFGIGAAGITFSLLGRKYGSPWVYAALEKGMEAFPGQPTVWQLKEDYRWEEIHGKTRFLGVVGMGEAERVSSRVLNAAFRSMEKPIRCLPLIPNDLGRLQKMLAMMKVNGLLVEPSFTGDLTPLARPGNELSQKSGYMDILMQKTDGWQGIATLFDAVADAGERTIQREGWFGRGAVLVIGHTARARAAATAFEQAGAAVSLAAPSDNSATAASRECGVRQVPWNAVHDVRIDTLVLADHTLTCGQSKGQLNPGILRERLTVVDLVAYPHESSFAEEARSRGCRYLEPSSVFASQLRTQFRTLAGRDLPEEAFRDGIQLS
ncbi:MAG: type I 3-dehydroquinate dehydratase [Planctomycetaceae bacterium]|nr:type I 3-dehydroquinate dehydratase [Planctomycetaceae bacterium]